MSVIMASIAKQASENTPSMEATDRVVCAFNPESLRVSYSKPQPPQSSGGGNNSESTTEPNNVRLDVTLFFDTTEGGEDVRSGKEDKNGTKVLKALASPTDGAPAPTVFFDWGTFRFVGTIETLTETLDYWSAEGIPLRASVQLSIAGQRLDEFNAPPRAFARVSPPTGGWGTTEIATLGGNSGATRDINAQNEVENPRFPALDKAGKAIDKVNSDIDGAFDEVNENLEEANEAFGELNESLDKLTVGSDKSLGGGLGSASLGGSAGGAGLSLGLSAGVGIKAAAGFKLGFSAGASVGFGFGASAGGGAGFGIGAGAGFGLGVDIGIGLGGASLSLSASTGTSGNAASGASDNSASAGTAALIAAGAAQGGMTSQTGYSGSPASAGAVSGVPTVGGSTSPFSASGTGQSSNFGRGTASPIRIGGPGGSVGSFQPVAPAAARISASIAAPTPPDSKRSLASLTAAQGAFAGLGISRRRPARLDISAIAAAPATPTIGPNTTFDVLGRANGGSGLGTAIARMPRSVSAARSVRMN